MDNIGRAAATGVEVAVDGGTSRLGRDVVFVCARGGLGGALVGYVCCACFCCGWAVVSVGTYIIVFVCSFVSQSSVRRSAVFYVSYDVCRS